MKPIRLTHQEASEALARVDNRLGIAILRYALETPDATPSGLTEVSSKNFAKLIRKHINPKIADMGIELDYFFTGAVKGRSFWSFRKLIVDNSKVDNWRICSQPTLPKNCMWTLGV